ncbi:serine/threonine protein kinase [Ktedonosporobacter rubrisoli]|uniref:non-specific serine/threonine protein kinase n=1 Tax=Ktedonosporobacter rubrisoli TaxID=2509675 RepID=A0A4P6JPM9_KTERU|nr:serine/threonine-protein kinase [Ktedonosporobacter rubrisoli]QBD77214.1 serine/threonine protein kinase [Ktedonosporobacter rubrisoli]
MPQQKTTLSPGDNILERYKVEAFLGGGGFSSVYLVQDLQASRQDAEAGEAFFALKDLRTEDEHEKARFIFEGEVLRRFSHPALPRLYRVLEDTERRRVFLLLEYIEGPNLETLRRTKPERRLPWQEVRTLLVPVVEAIEYLHGQRPPVIHRDIKPANIIVPQGKRPAVLVDFGIAKEYEMDATTTAIRHCSPGYGAPEQYSGLGTDQRTDIYGLAATCYTLLSGQVPTDAFYRTTTLASKREDPLLPLNRAVPNVPEQVSKAISQALAIGQDQRFSTVEDFWQALNACEEGSDQKKKYALLHEKPSIDKSSFSLPATSCGKRQDHGKPKWTLFWATLIALVLILSLLFGLGLQTMGGFKTSTRKSGTSPTSQAPSNLRASSYSGTIYDVATNRPTPMSLTNIEQHLAEISGTFSGLHTTGAWKGVLDTSKHIFFTVSGSQAHAPFFFQGSIRADGQLVGNYCTLDQAGQCTSGYGIWSVSPGTLGK